jgi:hypothetical protein
MLDVPVARWDAVLMLPTERFMKQSKQRAWADSTAIASGSGGRRASLQSAAVARRARSGRASSSAGKK